MGVDQPHGDSGVACKGAVDGIVGQDLAVDAVAGDGGDGADEVGGVDVLDVGLLELLLQQVPHPHPHILQDGVAALVRLLLTLGQNLLHANRGCGREGNEELIKFFGESNVRPNIFARLGNQNPHRLHASEPLQDGCMHMGYIVLTTCLQHVSALLKGAPIIAVFV